MAEILLPGLNPFPVFVASPALNVRAHPTAQRLTMPTAHFSSFLGGSEWTDATNQAPRPSPESEASGVKKQRWCRVHTMEEPGYVQCPEWQWLRL